MLIEALEEAWLSFDLVLNMALLHWFYLDGGKVDLKLFLQHPCHYIQHIARVLVSDNMCCENWLFVRQIPQMEVMHFAHAWQLSKEAS